MSSIISKYDDDNNIIVTTINDIDNQINELNIRKQLLQEQMQYNDLSKQAILLQESPSLSYLPFDIIKILLLYIYLETRMILFNTNKHYMKYKHTHFYYSLNQQISIDYYMNRKGMRDTINMNVNDPSKQISLYFNNTSYLNDISVLAGVHKLSLINCSKIADVTPLSNVSILDLSYSKGFSDISTLGSVQHLSLIDCGRDKIQDLSSLTNNTKLTISDLRRVKYYPENYWGTCQELDFSNFNIANKTFNTADFFLQCSRTNIVRLTNMSDLRSICDWNNQQLFLSHNSDLQNISELKQGMVILVIKHCNALLNVYNILDVQTVLISQCHALLKLRNFSNIKTLVVHYCVGLMSLINIKNVERLELTSLILFNELVDIINVRSIELKDLNLVDLSALGHPDANVQVLKLENLKLLTSDGISQLGRIPEIHLDKCPLIDNISALKTCTVLSILNLPKVVDVSSLGNLNTLTLHSPHNTGTPTFQLAGIVNLGTVEKLTLSNVNLNNQDLVALATVDNLTLTECGKFTDIRPLSKVKTLNLIRCIDLKSAKALVGKVKNLRFVPSYKFM